MIVAAEGQQGLEAGAYWERPTSAADCLRVLLELEVFRSAFGGGPAAEAAAGDLAAEVVAVAGIAVLAQVVVDFVPGKRQEAPGCLQAAGM